ncbi:hypothetical protein [Ornithinibacillus bavariensis]|uniref:hypothetical protein n=1 Tax=Ornithinibacillus bavariensis TaxID=545502 RepID=UPI000EEEFD02|nr:hypothetical protein [Ornithinibacillus sp.]
MQDIWAFSFLLPIKDLEVNNITNPFKKDFLDQSAKKVLHKWTMKFFVMYMAIMIAIYLVESFGMNMVSDIVVVMGIFIILAVLIIEIMFLVLIYKYRGLN